VATVTGTVAAVADAVATLGVDGPDILGPVDVEGGGVRTIVRFDYAHGAEIAQGLRAEVVKAAANRRRALGKASRGPAPVNLKVRFDDVEPFLEQ
jgi:primosomal protein N' (replication factor Y)